jgi:hypothetical protein
MGCCPDAEGVGEVVVGVGFEGDGGERREGGLTAEFIRSVARSVAKTGY